MMMKNAAISLLVILLGLLPGCNEACAAEENGAAGTEEEAIAKSIGMKLVLIPAGEFMMGSPGLDAYPNEKPQHRVQITRPFYLGAHEVTVGQFLQFVEATEKENKWDKQKFRWKQTDGDDYPVVNVSWDDAVLFCKWLSAKEGKTYRLPTEAEWEYACRAGTTTQYSFGDDEEALGDYAWYGDNSDGRTHPVGQKKPNAWGLYDMHGNVWEWCADWYDSRYYAASATDDPKGPDSGATRVLRGGCWFDRPDLIRSAYRLRDTPGKWSRLDGFRVATTP